VATSGPSDVGDVAGLSGQGGTGRFFLPAIAQELGLLELVSAGDRGGKGGLKRQRIDYTRTAGPLTQDLIAYWPLREDGGRIIAEIHNGDLGSYTFTNAVETMLGQWGGRAVRSAPNSFTDVSLGQKLFADKPKAGSFSCWIRFMNPDTLDLYTFVIGTSLDDILILGTDAAGALKIYFDNEDRPTPNLIQTSAAHLGDARWHHVTYSSDGSAYKIYVDGVSVALTVVFGSNDGAWASELGVDNPFGYLLAQSLGASAHDVGLSDIGLWRRALRDDEVMRLAREPDAVYARQVRTVLLDRYRLHPAGIASAETFGTLKLTHALKFTGIASAEALGTHELAHVLKLFGIASAEALGTPNVAALLRMFGIASAESLGTPELVHLLKITGIGSAEALGTPNIAALLRMFGIASAEALGTPKLVHLLKMLGIASAEAVGLPELTHLLKITGIGSAEAVGLPDLAHVLKLGGIAPAAALGTPNLALLLRPSGIGSAEAVGIPELVHVLKLAGISSSEAFGALVLSGPQITHAIGMLARARAGKVDLQAVAGGITVALSRSGQLFMIVKIGGLDRESAIGDVSGEGKI
jgi:hypothetical protein